MSQQYQYGDQAGRTTDEYGNPVRQTDEYGNPVRQSGATGGGMYGTTTETGRQQHGMHGGTTGGYGTGGDLGSGYGTTGTGTGMGGYGTTGGGTGGGSEYGTIGGGGAGYSTGTTTGGMGTGYGSTTTTTGQQQHGHMHDQSHGGGYEASGEQQHEKKGILDKIKEKLPGQHDS